MSEANELPGPGGSSSEIILYQTEDRRTQIDVRLDGETVWLNQQQMADLFDETNHVEMAFITLVFAEG